MVEAADEVLSSGKVGTCFAADRGIDLREEGCGNLEIRDAAHVDGGEEAGQVADDSSSKGDEKGVAVGSRAGELLGESFDGREAFVDFACGQEEDLRRCGEAGEKRFRPGLPDVRGGDDEDARGFGGEEFSDARVEGAEDSGCDVDLVRGGGSGDGDGGHVMSMIAQGQAWLVGFGLIQREANLEAS